MSEKKTDFVRRMVAEKNYKAALRTASDFRLDISPEDHATMKRGYEAMIWPDFYKSIKIDVPEAIRKAVDTVERLYGQDHSQHGMSAF